jgi:branched-chain amino acid transport system substrate-binding protein
MNLLRSVRAMLVALTVLLATVVAGSAAVPSVSGAPVVIPVILPLVGSAAFLGQSEQQTLSVLEHVVNTTGGIHGRPLKFNFLDDQSDPAIAVAVTRSVMASNPPVIIGSSISANCGAIAPLVAAAGPVQYCLSPGLVPKPHGFTFVSSVPLVYLQPVVIRFARDIGLKRIAVIAATDASGQESYRAIQRAQQLPENADIKIVSAQFINPSDISGSAQVLTIKAADPQIVIASVTGTALGNVLRTFKDVGLKVPVIISGANANREQLLGYASFIPEALYVNGFRFLDRKRIGPGPLRETIEQMYAAFKSTGVPFSEAGVSFGWDPGKIVVDALRKLDPDVGPEQLRAYLDTHHFIGINGIYNFSAGDGHGLTDQAAIMLRWNPKAGALDPVSGPRGIPFGK